MQNVELQAGKLIVFSSGEYSDYGYHGAYVCLQSVSHEDIVNLQDEVNKSEEYCKQSLFQSACIRKGWLAQIELREIHLGSYGDLELA